MKKLSLKTKLIAGTLAVLSVVAVGLHAQGYGVTCAAGTCTLFLNDNNGKQVIFSLGGGTAGTATTLAFAQTANRTVTFPDASITVNPIVVTNCGLAVSGPCGTQTNTSSSYKVITGNIAYASGTSAVSVNAGLPFTSSTTFSCQASDSANAYTINAKPTAGTAVTFTASSTNADTINYNCAGT